MKSLATVASGRAATASLGSHIASTTTTEKAYRSERCREWSPQATRAEPRAERFQALVGQHLAKPERLATRRRARPDDDHVEAGADIEATGDDQLCAAHLANRIGDALEMAIVVNVRMLAQRSATEAAANRATRRAPRVQHKAPTLRKEETPRTRG